MITIGERQTKSEIPFDVERIRADFPILDQKVHGKPLVYLDNAASSQKPRAVIHALKHYYENDHANVHRGVHALSERATEAYEEARIAVQKFIGAPCLRELIFTRGATEAINLIAQTFGRVHVHAGDEVILTALEHHSNIVPWQVLCWEKHANLRVVPINDDGELRLDELEKLINPATRIISVAHVSNALGTINPIQKIIDLAHQRGVYVVIDGAQAAPHLRVDVQKLDCDFYAFSGHKVYGPTGIGALYGKPQHLELMPPYQTGGDMISYVSFEKTTWNQLPYKFEAGTPNIAGAIGLAAAVEYLEEIGRDSIASHEHRLLEFATERIASIPGVRIIGTAKEKASVLSFVVEDMSALDVGTRLDIEGIAVRTGHHCCQPLMERFGIAGTTRASFAMYNTLEEVEAFAEAVEKIVASARPRAGASLNGDYPYPQAAAPSTREAAEEIAEVFEVVDDWAEKYEYLIDIGSKLPAMPDVLKQECNRVQGCQSTVFMHARKKPGTPDVIEFLADSDADIVRGELALLQRLYSGQRAGEVLAFDMPAFMQRIGLDKNLTQGRRNGLAEMVQRVMRFAENVAGQKP
ncbi:MAG: SufS family cysteine desulfurase [Planctomycetes bacterium]|nr:SufS family cysteine desulfurase [Planctomycetota bacterium]